VTNRSKRSTNDSWAISDKPRDRNAFIIDGGMKRMILFTGGVFFLLLLGFVYVCEHADVTSLTDLCNLQFGTGMGLSALEKSYNARTYLTGQSAFPINQNSPSFDGKRGSFSLGPPCFVQKVARE